MSRTNIIKGPCARDTACDPAQQCEPQPPQQLCLPHCGGLHVWLIGPPTAYQRKSATLAVNPLDPTIAIHPTYHLHLHLPLYLQRLQLLLLLLRLSQSPPQPPPAASTYQCSRFTHS